VLGSLFLKNKYVFILSFLFIFSSCLKKKKETSDSATVGEKKPSYNPDDIKSFEVPKIDTSKLKIKSIIRSFGEIKVKGSEQKSTALIAKIELYDSSLLPTYYEVCLKKQDGNCLVEKNIFEPYFEEIGIPEGQYTIVVRPCVEESQALKEGVLCGDKKEQIAIYRAK